MCFDKYRLQISVFNFKRDYKMNISAIKDREIVSVTA